MEALTGLPTYRVERVRKVSNTRRLMALSRLLTTLHAVDMTAWDGSKKLVIDTLDAEAARLKKRRSQLCREGEGLRPDHAERGDC
ncbi:MAG: hypothetical protein IPL70_14470 [Uliginosibacterium sp.]|nr:hypothetical protein [Uliginosibacterium sp.]